MEKIARNIITWNIGWKSGFGKFETQPHSDPAQQASRAMNLMSAISSQVIPSTDLSAVNRLREDLGVSPITQDEMVQLAQMAQAMQSMQGMGAGGDVEGTPPEQ